MKSHILDDFMTPDRELEKGDKIIQELPLYIPQWTSIHIKNKIVDDSIWFLINQKSLKVSLINDWVKEYLQWTLKSGNVFVGYGVVLASYTLSMTLLIAIRRELETVINQGLTFEMIEKLFVLIYSIITNIIARKYMPSIIIHQKEIIEV